MEPTSIEQLLLLLIEHGGSIVLAKSLPDGFVAQAKASGRLFISRSGNGFVWEPEPKIPTTEEEVKFFEKWYPQDMEVPDELKNASWMDGFELKKKQIKEN